MQKLTAFECRHSHYCIQIITLFYALSLSSPLPHYSFMAAGHLKLSVYKDEEAGSLVIHGKERREATQYLDLFTATY